MNLNLKKLSLYKMSVKKIKYYTGRYFFLLVAGVVFSSCASTMYYTTLDIMRPAEVTFPVDAQHLLIVNNASVQPEDYGHTTKLINQISSAVIPTDSLSLFCLSVLSEEIEQSDFFTNVDMIINPVSSDNEFYKIKPLKSDVVKRLKTSYNADVVISLDRIVVKDELVEQYFDNVGLYVNELKANYETIWSIYSSDTDYKNVSYLFKDSLFWESEHYYRPKASERMPDRQDALIDGAMYVGQKMTDRFVPYWIQVDRYFYDSSNKYMKQGLNAFFKKDWTGAIDMWKNAINNIKKKRLIAEAASNIAATYEIIGDYDNAIEYATYSLNVFSTTRGFSYWDYNTLSNYIVQLVKRKEDVEKLKKQLGD